ncbi:hypothetical protein MACH26_39870 [Planctobacterium marinum]|uniref:Phytanoyl-CoA dioxygenase n=2 Tax=Planctobacterium marinum TaxID=1631968 RepID=A0AA48HL64_9ALTE|nr:hypothetical protein MACH26_39870 [Planctobacterium marinum]
MEQSDIANLEVNQEPVMQLMWRLMDRSPASCANAKLKGCFLTRGAADVCGKGLQHFIQMLFECQGQPQRLWQSMSQCPSFSASDFNLLLSSCLDNTNTSSETISGPLTSADLKQWREQGYVVVKNIIPRDTSLTIAERLMNINRTSLQTPDSWHRAYGGPFFRQEYDIPELDVARQSIKARQAFQQVWQREHLITTRDTYSLNFPETARHYFQGTKLHLDVDFHLPLHFKTQGIVYLNDVAAEQGALTLCTGFHLQYAQWLSSLPKAFNPNDSDFTQFKPKPIAAEAGDLIIWHHWLPHGASPNHHHLPRVAQYLDMYSLTPSRLAPDEAF